ncbi:hypothetical protein [Sphingomonas glacialis]|uniref:PH domain-containing protein n=1 Tax=Sphingomonas glacialis TaxID=658225 RepID=A0A502G4C3_9SPHN|nr:hypothetical protein [Sphingomonas glacialis]TPG56066.1 hypothetical protein EAH76_00340 [Sphingomonas glacialis]
MDTIRYDYQPNTLRFALAAAFCAGSAVLMAKFALDNDRGMIIDGLIRLDRGAATVFQWAVAGTFAVGLFIALAGLARSFGPAVQVVLDRHAISAPKSGFSRTVETVRYAEISGLRLTQIRSHRFLELRHPRGKFTIACSMLPSEYDFDTLVDTVRARCRVHAR